MYEVLFFAHRGHFQELKVRDLKLLCLESIVRYSIPDTNVTRKCECFGRIVEP